MGDLIHDGGGEDPLEHVLVEDVRVLIMAALPAPDRLLFALTSKTNYARYGPAASVFIKLRNNIKHKILVRPLSLTALAAAGHFHHISSATLSHWAPSDFMIFPFGCAVMQEMYRRKIGSIYPCHWPNLFEYCTAESLSFMLTKKPGMFQHASHNYLLLQAVGVDNCEVLKWAFESEQLPRFKEAIIVRMENLKIYALDFGAYACFAYLHAQNPQWTSELRLCLLDCKPAATARMAIEKWGFVCTVHDITLVLYQTQNFEIAGFFLDLLGDAVDLESLLDDAIAAKNTNVFEFICARGATLNDRRVSRALAEKNLYKWPPGLLERFLLSSKLTVETEHLFIAIDNYRVDPDRIRLLKEHMVRRNQGLEETLNGICLTLKKMSTISENL